MYRPNVDLIVELSSNDKIWDSLNALAALCSAIAAYAAVKLSVTFRKQDLQSKRAYLTVKDPKIEAIQEDYKIKLSIPFENCGEHPAENVSIRILMINLALNTEPDFDIIQKLANPIPGKTPSAYINRIVTSPNTPEKLLLVILTYRDVILNKTFCESYYMKWSGISNAEFQENVCHASDDEKLKLQRHLGQKPAAKGELCKWFWRCRQFFNQKARPVAPVNSHDVGTIPLPEKMHGWFKQ